MPQAPRPTAQTHSPNPPHRAPQIGDPHDAPATPTAPAAGPAATPDAPAARAFEDPDVVEPHVVEPPVVLDRPPVYAAALPSTPVAARDGARVDLTAVRMLEEGAVKYNTFRSRSGFPSGATNLRTHLHVEAWVRDASGQAAAWADVHVSTYDGTVVHRETLPLARTPAVRGADDGGAVFVLDRELYQGFVATPGSVTPRPDARVVQYRLYAEHAGDVYTDGRVHLCYLRPDAMSG